jgi:peroxiredoxin
MLTLGLRTGVAVSCLVIAVSSSAKAKTPDVAQALKLQPVQDSVIYDRPTGEQAEKCTLKREKPGGKTGWVVRTDSGAVLRQFVDTNGDNVVDLWSYFRNGVEVYRDIDANFNGKADQYRWLNTGGTRWGIDKDENGTIDLWKVISAEEVSAEVVRAIKKGDAERFKRLLLSETEAKTLGVGAKKATALRKKVAAATKAFESLSRSQKSINAQTKWVDFGATQPGVVPAGTQGATKDLLVYENVVAMIDTAGKYEQINLGTVVNVGRCWRLIDAPQIADVRQTGQSRDGFFFQASLSNRPPTQQSAAPATNKKLQKLLADLEKLDQQGAKATTAAQHASNSAQRIKLLESLAQAADSPETRSNWVRQLADTLSVAIQSGGDSAGLERLGKLHASLAKSGNSRELAGYVKFRYLTASYSRQLQAPKADYAKIQSGWLKSLKQYIANYPNTADAAEALLQLAFAEEHAGNGKAAAGWYARIVSDFPGSRSAKKATGARRRLESVGRPMTLQGTTIDGRELDLSAYRGRIVLIHYWASWSEPCQADIKQLKNVMAKYTQAKFSIVGVSLDANKQDLTTFLASNRLAWPQIHESGGLDSRLANEMGILTLPTMILVGADGRVLNRNLHAGQLDGALKKHL